MSEIVVVGGGTLPLANLSKTEEQALLAQLASMEATTWRSILAMNGASKVFHHAATKMVSSLEEAQQVLQAAEDLPASLKAPVQRLTRIYQQTMNGIASEASAEILRVLKTRA